MVLACSMLILMMTMPRGDWAALRASGIESAGSRNPDARRLGSGLEGVRFDPPNLELGALRTGQSVDWQVILRNDGSTPLTLLELSGSCGCLRANAAQTTIPPCGTANIALSIHTLSAPPGEQAWNVKARYRQGGEDRTVTLPVRAFVVQEVVVQPPLLLVNSAGPTRHEFTITDRRSKPFQRLQVEATSPHLSVGPITESLDAAGRMVRRFALEIGDTLPVGRHDEQLVLHTDDPVHRELRVILNVTRRGKQRIEVLPSGVEVVASSSDPRPSRLVTLRDSQGQPLLIERLEAGDPAINCKAPPEANAVSAVRISLDRSKMKGDTLRSQVTVHFKQPEGESVVIPVSAIRR